MKISKLYMLIMAAVVIVACDPMKETYDEMDANPTSIVNDIEYTLTEDDYDLADAPFGNFSSEEDAKIGVPLVLNERYPQLGKGSSAIAYYDMYNGSSPDLRGTNHVETVSDEDYQALGFTFGNFSSNYQEDVATWANYKYPDARDGDHADVTFDYYVGTVQTRTERVVFTVAYGWKWAFVLPDEAYGDFFGESGTDFSNQDEGEEKMPVYLNYLLASGSDYNTLTLAEGTQMVVQYNYDDRCFGDDCTDPGEPNVPAVALYIFDGIEWRGYSDGYQVSEEVLKLGHDGTTWVPDNTIKYTMTGDDYTYVATEYADVNPAGAASMERYGNYDITIWLDEEIVRSIADVLLKNYGGAEEGQKYLVSYNVWTGSSGDTYTLHMIKSEGVYIPLEE